MTHPAPMADGTLAARWDAECGDGPYMPDLVIFPFEATLDLGSRKHIINFGGFCRLRYPDMPMPQRVSIEEFEATTAALRARDAGGA